MRTNIVHIGAAELTYEIREIVETAGRIGAMSGIPMSWENIGDPVQKGEKLPDWIKDIVVSAVREDATYGYCPTRGLDETRRFLAAKNNEQGGAHLEPEDLIFFNGLGDAVNKIYGLLRREARVIGPSPAYPTHSSAEAAHAGYPPITYRLDPERNWMPDLDELYNKVKYNESIAGIMIINPDNPTGAVFPPEIIRRMVAIAREFNLFIVADEIYSNMVYNSPEYRPVSHLIGDVPTISLKGISKEFPWPGARCGWMEVYNQKDNPMFAAYIRSILDAKMLEVCSTTLPQYVIPKIYSHPEWPAHQRRRQEFFAARSRMAAEIFADSPSVMVNVPSGAFYLSVVFREKLNDAMHLRIENSQVREYVDSLCVSGIQPDRRFVYHLLGSRNICTVPLSSFVSELQGFRCTLLEQDDEKFQTIYKAIANSVEEYAASALIQV